MNYQALLEHTWVPSLGREQPVRTIQLLASAVPHSWLQLMELRQSMLVGNLLQRCLQLKVLKLALPRQIVSYSLVFHLAFALRPKMKQCLRDA